MEKFELSTAKVRAAQALSDEIYGLVHDVVLVRKLLSDVFHVLNDDTYRDFSHPESLAYSIDEATWRVDIMVDYMEKLENRVNILDKAACSCANGDGGTGDEHV